MFLDTAVNQTEKQPQKKLQIFGLPVRAQTQQSGKRYLAYVNRKSPKGVLKK